MEVRAAEGMGVISSILISSAVFPIPKFAKNSADGAGGAVDSELGFMLEEEEEEKRRSVEN